MKIDSKTLVSTTATNKVGRMLRRALKFEDYVKITETESFKKGDTELDVRITINGVELDVNHFLTQLHDHFNESVSARVKTMFSDTVSKKVSEIFEALNSLEEKASSLDAAMPWDDIYSKKFQDTFVRQE